MLRNVNAFFCALLILFCLLCLPSQSRAQSGSPAITVTGGFLSSSSPSVADPKPSYIAISVTYDLVGKTGTFFLTPKSGRVIGVLSNLTVPYTETPGVGGKTVGTITVNANISFNGNVGTVSGTLVSPDVTTTSLGNGFHKVTFNVNPTVNFVVSYKGTDNKVHTVPYGGTALVGGLTVIY